MASQAVPTQAEVLVDAGARTPLRRIWRYVGYDELNYTYTPSGRSLLRKLGSLPDGPYLIRAHFLLCSGDGSGKPKWGSSNVYSERGDGTPLYSWHILDRILDTYVETGCIPFVELGFVPEALSSAPRELTYGDVKEGGWGYPPRDYDRWSELIRVLAEHCLKRYGLREVTKWYWELWNEPDIPYYWHGSVEEYCRLYDHTVSGLISVLPQARVGGPATTSPARSRAGAFLRSFLEHCVGGTNAVTGTRGTRLDFISFHSKGGGFRKDAGAAKQTPTLHTLLKHIDEGLKIISRFSELAGKELILSECDPDGWAAGSKHDNPNLNYRNTEYYASYVASAACRLMDIATSSVRVDGMLTWAFQFEDREYFEGLRTLSTHGVDKPVLGVFRLLSRLGGSKLELARSQIGDPLEEDRADSDQDPPNISGLAATNGFGEIQVFLCSHHDDWDKREATNLTITVRGLEADRSYRIGTTVVDSGQNNAFSVWRGMKEPQQPTDEQQRALQEAARLKAGPPQELRAGGGSCSISLTLEAHSIGLLTLRPL
jgi:xylan 1,4-beta-xylosidase